MKKLSAIMTLSAVGIALSAVPGFATVSTINEGELKEGSAFIRNSWVQGGLKANGSFGTTEAVPSGFDSLFDSQEGGLGLMDDSTEDGFDSSDNGDFFMPGTPYEGWGIKVDGNEALENNDEESEIPGSWTDFENAGDPSVTWESTGAVDGIAVTQVVSAPVAGDHLLRVTVTLENIDNEAHTVYYFRQVDPDNNQDTGGDYATFNRILSQSSSSQIVMGTAYHPVFSSIGYRAADPHAVVRISDWSSPIEGEDEDENDLTYTEAEMDSRFTAMRSDYKVGFQDYEDSTIDIVFRKDIPAGQSAVIGFDYILNPAEVGVPELALDLALDLEVGDLYSGNEAILSGGGLKPDSTYTLTEYSVPNVIFTGTTLPNGNFYDTANLPGECQPGSHTLVLEGTSPAGQPVQDLVTYTVDTDCIVIAFDAFALANGTPIPQRSLAETGFLPHPIIAGSVLAMLAGSLAVASSRRRKS